ncbi:MAG: IucA/IucC family protein [Francisellaceae bacterium]
MIQYAKINAERLSVQALINCFIREYAIPHKSIELMPLTDQPIAAFVDERLWFSATPIAIAIALDDTQRLMMAASSASTSNHYRLISPIALQTSNCPLTVLTARQVLAHITIFLAEPHESLRQHELAEQFTNSLENMTQFFAKPHTQATDFIGSEQNLITGHEYHPTPKARIGFSANDIKNYSPELGVRFQLFYFKVPKALLWQYGDIADNNPMEQEGQYILYPVHPWQADYMLANERLNQKLKDHAIEAIGRKGDAFYPTSSLRTLFHPEASFFYKFSLHVRLTNCLRKNAAYELVNAVEISHILSQIKDSRHPQITLLAEPASRSIAPHDRELFELFGCIYRQSIAKCDHGRSFVAAALFSPNPQHSLLLNQWIFAIAGKNKTDYNDAACQWFEAYITRLVPFILDYAIDYGVIFEPHCQNIIIRIDENDLPDHIMIRDLEGTKIIKHYHHNYDFSHLSEEQEAALSYNQEQAIRRLIYCLFINNIAAAVHHIARADFALEQILWQQLADTLNKYRPSKDTNLMAYAFLDRIIDAKYWPAKANLMTRFHKKADKDADYIHFNNPLKALQHDPSLYLFDQTKA